MIPERFHDFLLASAGMAVALIGPLLADVLATGVPEREVGRWLVEA